jgi:hypothetical protein
MSERPSDPLDPLDQLRRADPAQSNRPPSESRARVWARIQEVTMQDTTRNPTRPGRLALGFGAVAVAAVALAVVLLRGGGTPPDQQPGLGIGSCVETYSLDALANRDFAFDGTVTAIDGDQVTFAVGEVYTGEVGGSLTLTATGMTGTAVTSAGGLTLVAGERYLVAGDDEFVWSCGFTQPYDAAVAVDWAEALR